ncbi:MAG: DUF5681 domain-containing protein [Saprospiraceae bacterium]
MAKRVKQPHGGELTPFQPGQSGNPSGRPRKVFSTITEEWKQCGFEMVSPAIVKELFELMLSLPMAEIERLAGDAENPALVQIVAKELTGPRQWKMLLEMLDRTQGKPRQSADISTNGGNIGVGTFTGFGFLDALAYEAHEVKKGE